MDNMTEDEIISRIRRLPKDETKTRYLEQEYLSSMFSLALTACNIPRQELYSEKDNNTLVLSILRTIDPAGNWFMWSDSENDNRGMKPFYSPNQHRESLKNRDESAPEGGRKAKDYGHRPYGFYPCDKDGNQITDKAEDMADVALEQKLEEAKKQGYAEAYKEIESWLRVKPLMLPGTDMNPNDSVSLACGFLIYGLQADRADHKQYAMEQAMKILIHPDLFERHKDLYQWKPGIPS